MGSSCDWRCPCWWICSSLWTRWTAGQRCCSWTSSLASVCWRSTAKASGSGGGEPGVLLLVPLERWSLVSERTLLGNRMEPVRCCRRAPGSFRLIVRQLGSATMKEHCHLVVRALRRPIWSASSKCRVLLAMNWLLISTQVHRVLAMGFEPWSVLE